MTVQPLDDTTRTEDVLSRANGGSSHRIVRVLAASLTGIIVYMLVVWVMEDPTRLETDWQAFNNTGNRLREGTELYRPIDVDSEPLPWLYPPFALWLAWPLGFLGFWASYAFSALVPLVAFGAGLKLFAGEAGATSRDKVTAGFVAVLSGATVGATLIGQYSGLYVLFLAAGLALFTRGRHLLAGLTLALLWLKPNIAIAVPVVLLWSRSWGTLRGFAVGTMGLFVASLPFGLSRWTEFLTSAELMAELQEDGLVPLDKMVTVTAAFQETIGSPETSLVSISVFLFVAIITGVSVLYVWRPTALEQSPLRAFGALALFVVAANPRLYFYDAVVASAGMFAVWLSARQHSNESFQRTLTALAGLLWLGLWGAVFSSLNVIVGPVAAIALVVVAVESRSGESVTNHPTKIRSVAEIGNDVDGVEEQDHQRDLDYNDGAHGERQAA